VDLRSVLVPQQLHFLLMRVPQKSSTWRGGCGRVTLSIHSCFLLVVEGLHVIMNSMVEVFPGVFMVNYGLVLVITSEIELEISGHVMQRF